MHDQAKPSRSDVPAHVFESWTRPQIMGTDWPRRMACDGATIFAHACKLGMEGIVSKRRDFAYSSGRAKHWIKVKNPKAPAMLRIEEGTF
jgi:ATP-dependent DNA ligase